jgi:hypothetical protein
VAKNSLPQRRENLGPLKWGLRGFGRRGRLWAKLPHEDLGRGGLFWGRQGSHNFEKKSGFEVIKSVASVLPVKPALRGKNGQFLAI